MVRIALVGVITLLAMARPAMAVESVCVEMAAGVPRLTVDGKPVRARIFWGRPAGAVVVARARAKSAPNRVAAFGRPRRTFSLVSDSPSVFVSQVELAAQVAVDIVSFPVPLPWPRPGTPVDSSAADRACQMVLDANPCALLLPRIGMVPPHWWREAHPDDVMVWDQGPQTHADAVVASFDYRRDAAERLSDLVTHLEQRFGPHMAGYHPSGQNTGEWFYQESWKSALNGYSIGTQRAWRRWLRTRYRSDTALRQAWHTTDATLANANVPSPASRRAAPAGLLRDPVLERSLIDFAEFQQVMMADCVCHLAKAVRRATHGKKLVVFFYGYVFEFGALRNGPATSGHYALRRVLQSPAIDVLCAPISYWDRGLGQSGPTMTAAESVALAGKMFVFLNAWCLTAEEREALRAGTRGALTVWCYAPGYHDGYKTSFDAMRQLTGFRLKRVESQSASAEPTPRGRQLGLRHAVGVAKPVEPLFAVTDAKPGEILATYPDGSTAVALRQTDRGASLFVGPPGLSSELLRLAARQAHVHLFTDTECNVWANGPFVLLHAAHDGPVTLNTAHADPIHDLLTGAVLGRGPKITLTLKRGETRAFRIRDVP